MSTTEAECLDVTPAASTILRVVGGWNEAKERAGLILSDTSEATVRWPVWPGTSRWRHLFVERVHVLVSDSMKTYEQGENGGQPVQPKPDSINIPDDKEWESLSGQQRWYYKNRDWRQEVKNQRKARLRRWLYEYERDECECPRCGESHPACLDFHHLGEKTMDISRMVNHGFAKESIRAEMDSCVVVCANCHRKEHYEIPDPGSDAMGPRVDDSNVND